MAIYEACSGSIYAHQPLELIRRKFSKPYKPYCKGIVEDLAKHPDGLVSRHSGRARSYGITMNGIAALRSMGLI
jgi:hypothetical protein